MFTWKFPTKERRVNNALNTYQQRPYLAESPLVTTAPSLYRRAFQMLKLVLFDIDGTLIQSGGAGERARAAGGKGLPRRRRRRDPVQVQRLAARGRVRSTISILI